MQLKGLPLMAREWARGLRPGRISLHVIARILPSDPVIVEAGAHIGTDTASFARFWPAATIHAFEPVPTLFTQLEARTAQFPNVHRYQLAVGDYKGSSTLFLSEGASDGSSSLLPPKDVLHIHPDITFDHQLSVEATTLDQWADRLGLTQVDLLWLDLQGAELHALRGAIRLLTTVRAIHTEVNLVESYDDAVSYADLRTWLDQQGFIVVREDLPWSDGGNVLFTRKTGS